MAAALGLHLIFDMDGSHAAWTILRTVFRDREGAAEAGIDIDQQRKIARRRDAANILQDIFQRGDPQVRQSEAGIGNAGTREIKSRVVPAYGARAWAQQVLIVPAIQRAFGNPASASESQFGARGWTTYGVASAVARSWCATGGLFAKIVALDHVGRGDQTPLSRIRRNDERAYR